MPFVIVIVIIRSRLSRPFSADLQNCSTIHQFNLDILVGQPWNVGGEDVSLRGFFPVSRSAQYWASIYHGQEWVQQHFINSLENICKINMWEYYLY
ncbi:hypothetical protein LINPERPRIM_LOCUS14882 [Linum perenne]